MIDALQIADCPYKSVRHALGDAYRWEAIHPVEISSIYRDLRGGTVKIRNGSNLSALDNVAQAAMTIAFTRRTIPEHARDIVELWYTVPEGIVLEGRKENLSRLMGDRLRESVKADKWFLVDVAREWSGLKPERDSAAWAVELGRDETTIRLWRNGRPSKYTIGAFQILDGMLTAAESELFLPMREAGLIP